MAAKLVCAVLVIVPTSVLCAAGFSCTTPNGESAICTDLTDCDILLKAATSKEPSSIKFFKASSCGDLMVCCGTVGNFTSPPEAKPSPSSVHKDDRNITKEEQKNFALTRVLPRKTYCGLQHYDDYFHDEDETTTSIYEFPWLLYISLYRQKNEVFNGTYELRCGGVLISKQYALTASECDALHFTTVQIGQHNRFKNSDCIHTASFGKECNEPLLTVEVEEKVKSNNGILLLRFAEPLRGFSNYVRPICLPLEESDRPKVGEQLTSSGWGDVTLEESNVLTKKKVQHILKDPYEGDLVYVNSTNYTDCFGDEGGPLMRKDKRNQWFVEAILPPYFCLRNTPARRINQEIIDWIIDNVRCEDFHYC